MCSFMSLAVRLTVLYVLYSASAVLAMIDSVRPSVSLSVRHSLV